MYTVPVKSSNLLKENTIVSDDSAIHYYFNHQKNTQAIIFIHGIGVSSRYMLPLAKELGKTNTVYAVDLPGFGGSTTLNGPADLDNLAESVYQFIVSQHMNHPVLIGNSFGCQVILKMLKKYPAAGSKAVLTGPTMNIYERSRIKQIGRWVQNIKHEPTKKLSWILVKDIWECGILKVFKTLNTAIKDTPEVNLDEVQIPIMFIRGEHDPIAPTRWLDYLVAQNSRFSSKELPKAGHALNFNSPKPLARIINEFV